MPRGEAALRPGRTAEPRRLDVGSARPMRVTAISARDGGLTGGIARGSWGLGRLLQAILVDPPAASRLTGSEGLLRPVTECPD